MLAGSRVLAYEVVQVIIRSTVFAYTSLVPVRWQEAITAMVVFGRVVGREHHEKEAFKFSGA
jgi:hypothetical protein